jgi:hypothetical protein
MTTRFYPEAMPTYDYEPTSDKFAINFVDDGVGQGVVTLVPFKKGDIIFRFTGFFSAEITQFTLRVSDNLHLHDPFFMGKVLHSCDPNASVDMQTRTFTATKDIEAGEFVTMDYAQTEERLFKPFYCSCGSVNCRGYVTGYGELELVGHKNGKTNNAG